MLPSSFLRLGSFLVASLLVLAQQAPASFEALQKELGLSDAQVTELLRNSLRSRQEDVRPWLRNRKIIVHFPEGMDDSHKARLSEIAKVLERPSAVEMAIDLGLIRPEQWPGGYGSLCHNSFVHYAYLPYLADFGMTSSEIQLLAARMNAAKQPLWPQLREKLLQRDALLASGVRADSPAVVQLDSDRKKLDQEINAGPSRDLSMSVLDSTQKAKLAEFEKLLELLREAEELGLIFDPYVGVEVSCK